MRLLLLMSLISAFTINKAFSQTSEQVSHGYDLATELKNDTNRVYNEVDKEPEFPGGRTGFSNYLKENLKWPAGSKGAIGKVILTVVIERDGTVNPLNVPSRFTNLGPEFIAEAKRVVKKSPKWIPGYDKGKLVRVAYTIPVDFSIIK